MLNSADEYLKNITVLLIETAMRRGELASLRIENIDLNLKVLKLEDTKNGEDNRNDNRINRSSRTRYFYR